MPPLTRLYQPFPLALARETFAPPVTRVLLDWDILETHTPRVEVDVLDAQAITHLHTPWYLDATNSREVSYRESPRLPLTVAEAAAHLTALDGDRARHLDRIASACTPGGEAWLVLAYAVGARRLLLDGNHRVMANHVHHLAARIL